MYQSELSINSKNTKLVQEWLNNHPFKSGYLENCFAKEIILYETSLEYYDSLLEALVHGNHQPLRFKAYQLTHVIFKTCQKLRMITDGHWFNVKCHDNEKGSVERMGTCQFDSKHGLFNEIFILYDILERDVPQQDGFAYTGIVNHEKNWMLSIEKGTELIIK